MLYVLYFSGSLISILFAYQIAWKFKKSLPEKVLLFSVAIMPLGKLIYFPIPGLIGLKFQFVITSLAGIYGLFVYGVRRESLKLFLLMTIPVFSILLLEDYQWFFINYIYGNEQSDSVGLRLVSLALLITYFVFVYGVILRNKNIVFDIAEKFIQGVVGACVVGTIIFYGVWNGVFSVDDLLPISADTHIVDNFYRFNPGANVNEFSMILAFAIFFLKFARFNINIKQGLLVAFVIFEFATLTRASWIALVIAMIGANLSGTSLDRKFFLKIFFVFLVLLAFYVLFLAIPTVQELVISRTTFELGSSGEERVEKFQYVFDRVTESPLRLFFGYGWATNLYVHNVYLQLIYEIGLVGLLVFVTFFVGLFVKILLLKTGQVKKTSLAIIIFISISAVAHHTLYHVQTWLMLAVVAALTHHKGFPPLSNKIRSW